MASFDFSATEKYLLDQMLKSVIIGSSSPQPIQFSATGRFIGPNGLTPFAPGGLVPNSNRINVNTGITSTGLNGFSEKGEPEEWDMAIGEVYGYRWWKIAVPATLAGFMYQEGYAQWPFPAEDPLIGANHQPWKAGRNEAACTSAAAKTPTWKNLLDGVAVTEHEPPEARVPCGCGFWAYFDKDLRLDDIMGGCNGPNPTVSNGRVWLPVFGVVKGTGRVIIGEKGFRSQYAEIVGLCVSDRAKDQLKWNILKYGSKRADYRWRSVTDALYGEMEYVEQASSQERLRRIAFVEAGLSVSYPDALVLSDQEALTKYFPPDRNYA